VVSVAGTSKGKGFQGVMKRHNFKKAVQAATDRCSTGHRVLLAQVPILKGMEGYAMAGHMGSERVTVQNLTVVDVMPDQNLILLKGQSRALRIP